MTKTYINYFLKMLIKNKIIWAFLIFNFLSIILVEILIVGGSNTYNNIFDNSLIVLGVPNVLLLLTSAYCCVVLFLNTRNNNVDFYLFISLFTKIKIVIIKQLTIFIFLLHILILELVILFVRLSISSNKDNVALLGLIMLFSMLLMSFVWIAIFSYMGSNFNFIVSFLSIFLVSIGLTLAAILPVALQTSNTSKQSYDVSNKNNVVRAINVDDDGKILGKQDVIYQNTTSEKDNDVLRPKSNSVQSYLPFEAIAGFTPLLSSYVYNDDQANSKYKTNLRWAPVDVFTSSDFTSNLKNYKNIIFATSDFKTIYEYSDKNLLYKDLFAEIEADTQTKDLISNYLEARALYNDLNSTLVWDLTDKYKAIVIHLLGLQRENSLLYEVFNDSGLIQRKFPDFYDFIKLKANEDFSNLFKLLLFDRKTKNNIYAYQNIIAINKIKEFHPLIKAFDDNALADKYDIEYVKNRLFFLVVNDAGDISNIRYLSSNNLYKDIESYSTVFPNINNRTEWNSLIDQNSNLINLKNFISNAQSKITDLKPTSLNENAFDTLLINQELNYNYYTKNSTSWIYVLALISIASITQALLQIKVSRKDMT